MRYFPTPFGRAIRSIFLPFFILAPAIAPYAAPPVYEGIEPGEYMTRWALLGPIPLFETAPDESDMEPQRKAFEREWIDPAALDAAAWENPVEIEGDAFEWTLHESDGPAIQLDEIFDDGDFKTAYAFAVVRGVEEETRVVFGAGSDDAVRVWVNGELKLDRWAARPLKHGEDLVFATLKPGENRLALKVQNITRDWGFSIRPMKDADLTEPFVSAAGDGRIESVTALIGHGIDIDAKNEAGLTALNAAKLKGWTDVAGLLAAHGADDAVPMPSAEEYFEALIGGSLGNGTPAVVALAAMDGEIVYQGAFGFADIGNGVRATPETKFRIGSVTKQFTAAAILKLMEEGQLALDDPLSKFMPDYPRGDEVTIHHLLTHTSGIHSYTSKSDFVERFPTHIEPDELIELFKSDEYDFDPGEKWSYNNSGYFLLGGIVGEISGKPYAAYLEETFFEPLGMENTGVHNSKDILENEAYGYSYVDGAYQKAEPWDMSWAGGAGALYSTVGDLFRWNEAVFSGKVLKDSTLELAWTPVTLNNGTVAEAMGAQYGYGWGLGEFRGLREISHGGGLHGFLSNLARYPEQRFTAVAFTNCAPPAADISPGGICQNLAEYFLWEEMDTRETPVAMETDGAADFSGYAGRYEFPASLVLAVTAREGKLYAQATGQPEYEIFPKGEDEFFWKVVDAQIRFVRGEDGKVDHAVHSQGGRSFKAPRMPEIEEREADPAWLDACVGKYQLSPQAILDVTREDGRLFIQLTGQPKFEAAAREDGSFVLKMVNAELTFETGEDGAVKGVTLLQGGTKVYLERNAE